MIPIVKPFLPELSLYNAQVGQIFDRNYLTNNGPVLRELEAKLAEYFGVPHLLLVANGTIAIQIALMALEIKGKVITTPFSFAATSSTLAAMGLTPEFADIDAQSLNIDPKTISEAQLAHSSAILPVHVYGNACDVDELASLAKQHDLKIIYDAAHTFGAKYKGKALLSYGDAATISLHATKIFHTVEGGAIAFKHKQDYEKAKQLINFGFDSNNMPNLVGINAKMSELHAAMGLCLFEYIDNITSHRAELFQRYQEKLDSLVYMQEYAETCRPNGAYAPIILANEAELEGVQEHLAGLAIQTRRYFYPSLSLMECYKGAGDTPIANDICSRVLCLPMYYELSFEQVDFICASVSKFLTYYRGRK
ncbi:DegT/DnrJ/EryC1/StrS family aminotransferase [Thalassotalea euphylliae]|uniref:DegT/DnrJ/EryC1/StrS family aminotransferase n=1 Tax=Thalassotalea euphylliae TaxID=1655234 RepID=A0A3E0U0W3_9GAMM|nr:DegT/DnrJ/EryC1/StrS family aminotransferase [Thalassotalea euphylliae]REL30223.1 DegT/DnrJ/EryC1/StrS family aminotransferase [Thalassotalea euphylliae]